MKKFVTIMAVLVIAAATVVVFKKRVETMSESRAGAEWRAVRSDTSAAALQFFIAKHPKSTYAAQAQTRLDSLRMERAWQKTLAVGTLDALMQFTSQFPKSPYILKADSLDQFQAEKEWLKARTLHSPQAYQDYLSKHPQTRFAAKAESLLIALEVAGILMREHSTLPGAQRMTTVDSQTSVVEIENQTRYTLTVRYSGKDSKRLTLKPKEKITTILSVGHYKVTASAGSSEVIPFAGEQELEGGEYVSRYFIRAQ